MSEGTTGTTDLLARCRAEVEAGRLGEAVRLARRAVDADPEGPAALDGLHLLQSLYRALGEPLAAAATLERLERLARLHGRPEAVVRALVARAEPGDLDRAVALATELDDPLALTDALLARVARRLAIGAREEAGADLVAARVAAAKGGRPFDRLRLALRTAELALAEDRPQEALVHVDRAAAEAVDAGVPHPEQLVARVRGAALWRLGRRSEAEPWLSAAAQHGEVEAVEEWLAALAEVGRWGEVRQAVSRPGFAEHAHPAVLALARGLAAEGGAVADALDEARRHPVRGRERPVATLASALAARVRGHPALEVAALALELRALREAGASTARTRAALAELGRGGAFVGDLRLVERLAGGASGVVWRATHATGATVAVKLLASHASRRARRSQLDELRALATLDHPNVVALLGHGALDEVAELMGVGPADTPYLVLEFVEGSSLDPLCGAVDWSRSRALLRGVLEGLAHAHARRCLHLDLKPANVVVDARGAPKLVDFGLARRRGDARRQGVAGTPGYMAPEQVRADQADLGPWTDLYAVGALGWALVSGAPPFADEDRDRVFAAHLGAPVPKLPADAAAPRGFDEWARWLLEKRPDQRPASAAEAADALAALPSEAARPRSRPSRPAELPTLVRGKPSPQDDTDEAPPAPRVRPPRPLPEHAGESRIVQPRFTSSSVAGLSLLALRRPALVGREGERSRLWAALRDAQTRRTPTVCALLGSPGVGTSRLAAWLEERALELGLARVLTLGDDPSSWASVGAEDLGLTGLTSGRLAKRLAARVPEREERDLWLQALTGEGAPLPAAAFRQLLVRHLVRRASAERTLVVLDRFGDAHRQLIDELSVACVPLLVVVVGDVPAHHRIEVGPLGDAHLAELFQQWLPLDTLLRAELIGRSAGRPAVGRELLLGLALGGHLRPEPGGWKAVEGRRSLAEVLARGGWTARVPVELRGAVQVMSVLGEASPAEVAAAARGVGTDLAPATLERAIGLGLADRVGERVRVVPALAEGVRAELDPATARQLHAACADLGDERWKARHLRRAGRPLEALTHLSNMALAALAGSDWPALRDWLEEWRAALEDGEVAASRTEWGDWTVTKLTEARKRGDLTAARDLLARLRTGMRSHAWHLPPWNLSVVEGDLAMDEGRTDDAIAHFEAALASGRSAAPTERLRVLCSRLAFALLMKGELARAIASTEEAIALGDTSSSVRCLLAGLRSRAGDRDGAIAALVEARRIAGRDTVALAEVTAAKAERAAFDQSWGRARDLYLEAARRLELVGLFRSRLFGNAAISAYMIGDDEQASTLAASLHGRTTPSDRVLVATLELFRSLGEPGEAWRAQLTALRASPQFVHLRDTVLMGGKRRALRAGFTARAAELVVTLATP